MFPIRDTIPTSTRPYVVYAIVAANFFVFLREISLGLLHGGGREISEFFFAYGLVPAFYSEPGIVEVALGRAPTLFEQGLPFLSSLFLHGGIMHILGNMWMLWIFGDNVEDRLGHIGFSLFYLGCGVAAGLTHLVFNFDSAMPVIGASGAIAGVMGAYMVLYPRARVVAAIPIFFFLYFMELPAFVFLGFWFVLQLFNSSLGGASSVAWMAHIGGFVVGAIFALILGGGRSFGGPGSFHRRAAPLKFSDSVDKGWRR